MVSIEDAVIARLSKGNRHFEIMVDPELALKVKKGKPVSIENVLAVREVFKDAKKGEKVQDSDLTEVFGTTDTLQISGKIINEGEVQFTTEQRKKLVEEKQKQIADIISKQGINPQTKKPHPTSRIINAMEKASVEINPFRPASEQVDAVLDKIRPIIPISFETVEIAVRIPIKYAGKANSKIRSSFNLKKEEWKSDAWIGLVEVPAGMQSDVYEKVNDITAGNAEIKVVKRKETG